MGTFSPGCVFFKIRFLQIPWHLGAWNIFCLFVVIYWIQFPFVSWAAPEKWSAFGLASCIRSRIYHWRSDSFPVFQFSQWNLLTFFVSRTPLLQLRNWPFYGYDNQVFSLLYHVIWNNHENVRFKFDNSFTSTFSWWLI